jgi:Protein of unknown function (DUF973).
VSDTNVGVLERLKDASLWLFLSLGLLYLGISIPALGFLVSLAGLYLLIGKGAPRLRSVMRDIRLIGLLEEDRSNWVSILNLSAVGIVIGEVFLAVSGLLLFSFAHPIGFGLSVFGDAILALSLVGAFVASVFLGISLIDLGNAYSSDILKIAGVLSALPFISPIGWLLAYAYLDSLILDASRQQGPAGPRPSSQGRKLPSVYAEGYATIRGNGQVTLTLVTNSPLTIANAYLLGYQTRVRTISPNVLSVGRNLVVIYFDNLPPLVQGASYTLVVAFSDGSSVSVQAFYVP